MKDGLAAVALSLLPWLVRLPALRHRWLIAWMAFGLLCASATLAVWTSGGGLETRQFTLFIVVAVVCLSLWRTKRWGLVAASLSLALAAYTRPEELLVGFVCIGWFIVQSMATPPPPPSGLAAALIIGATSDIGYATKRWVECEPARYRFRLEFRRAIVLEHQERAAHGSKFEYLEQRPIRLDHSRLGSCRLNFGSKI